MRGVRSASFAGAKTRAVRIDKIILAKGDWKDGSNNFFQARRRTRFGADKAKDQANG